MRDDGSCAHLGDHNRCTIYEDRPDACRISWWKDRDRDPDGFDERTAEACNMLQERQGIDPEFRVVLD